MTRAQGASAAGWQAAFSEGQRLRARILFVDPTSKRVGLSLLPHLLSADARLPALPAVGTVYEVRSDSWHRVTVFDQACGPLAAAAPGARRRLPAAQRHCHEVRFIGCHRLAVFRRARGLSLLPRPLVADACLIAWALLTMCTVPVFRVPGRLPDLGS